MNRSYNNVRDSNFEMQILLLFIGVLASPAIAGVISYQTNPSEDTQPSNYSPLTKSADLLKEIDDGSKSKYARKDIDHPVVLCWVETTTLVAKVDHVKEIYREFAILVEMESNFDKFCFRYNNMYTMYYRGKYVALFQEVTSVDAGDKTITKVKRFKCAQGAKFTKNVMSWKDSPRKRVQISNFPIHNICRNYNPNDREDECSKILEELTSTYDKTNDNGSEYGSTSSDNESRHGKLKWNMFNHFSNIPMGPQQNSVKHEDTSPTQFEDHFDDMILTSSITQVEKPSKKRHNIDNESDSRQYLTQYQNLIDENYRKTTAGTFRNPKRQTSNARPTDYNRLSHTCPDVRNGKPLCSDGFYPTNDGTQIVINERSGDYNCCSCGCQPYPCQKVNRLHDLLMSLKFTVNYEEDYGKAPIIKLETQNSIQGKNDIITQAQNNKIQRFLSNAFTTLGQQLSNNMILDKSYSNNSFNRNIDHSPDLRNTGDQNTVTNMDHNGDSETQVERDNGQGTGVRQGAKPKNLYNTNNGANVGNNQMRDQESSGDFATKNPRQKPLNNVNIGINVNDVGDRRNQVKNTYNTIQNSGQKGYNANRGNNGGNYKVTEDGGEGENGHLGSFEHGNDVRDANLDASVDNQNIGINTGIQNNGGNPYDSRGYRPRENDNTNTRKVEYTNTGGEVNNDRYIGREAWNEDVSDKGSEHRYQTNDGILGKTNKQVYNADKEKRKNIGLKMNGIKSTASQVRRYSNTQQGYRSDEDRGTFDGRGKHLNKASNDVSYQYAKHDVNIEDNEKDNESIVNDDLYNRQGNNKRKYTPREGSGYNSDGIATSRSKNGPSMNQDRASAQDDSIYNPDTKVWSSIPKSRPFNKTPNNLQNNNLQNTGRSRNQNNLNRNMDSDDYQDTRNIKDIEGNRQASDTRFDDIDRNGRLNMNTQKDASENDQGYRGVSRTEENVSREILDDQNQESEIGYSVGQDRKVRQSGHYDYEHDNDANGSLPRDTYDRNVRPSPSHKPSVHMADRKHDNDSYNVPQNMLQQRPPNQRQPLRRNPPYTYNVPQNTSARPLNLRSSRRVS